MQSELAYLNSLLEQKYPDKVVIGITQDRSLYYRIQKLANSKNLDIKEFLSSLGYTYIRRPKVAMQVESFGGEYEDNCSKQSFSVSCRELLSLSKIYEITARDITKLCNVSRQHVNVLLKTFSEPIELTEYILSQQAIDAVASMLQTRRTSIETDELFIHVCKHRSDDDYIILYKDMECSCYVTKIPARLQRLIDCHLPTNIHPDITSKVMNYIQQNRMKLGYRVSSSGIGYITKINMTCYKRIICLLGLAKVTPFIDVCKKLDIILDLKPTTYRLFTAKLQQLLSNTLKYGYIFAENTRTMEYKEILKLANTKGVSIAEYLEPYGVLYIPNCRYYKIFGD